MKSHNPQFAVIVESHLTGLESVERILKKFSRQSALKNLKSLRKCLRHKLLTPTKSLSVAAELPWL